MPKRVFIRRKSANVAKGRTRRDAKPYIKRIRPSQIKEIKRRIIVKTPSISLV